MVAFPEFENGRLTDSLEILLEGPVDTVSREGRTEVLAREYLLTCFSPADYRLGRFPALYADKNLVDTIWSPDSLRVIVTAPPVDTASHTIYDIEAPLKVPLRFGEVSGYLLLRADRGAADRSGRLCPAAEARTRAARGVARSRRPAACGGHQAARKTAYAKTVAERQIETVLHRPDRYPARIPRRTLQLPGDGDDLGQRSSRESAQLSVEERASKRLGSLLEVADFVKFAKYEPDAVQNEDAYQDAYYFVEETKQLPPELQPQQAGNDTPQGNVPGPTGTSGGLKPSGVPGAPDIPDTPGGAAAGGTSDEAGEGKEVRS